jgi:excisionase family DNA binding protein
MGPANDCLAPEHALLTMTEVAARLTISRRTLQRMVAAGEFPAPLRRNRKWVRWRLADVQRFLDTRAAPVRAGSVSDG